MQTFMFRPLKSTLPAQEYSVSERDSPTHSPRYRDKLSNAIYEENNSLWN